ncbi:hypothetical protein ACNR90_000593 [Candidozyma auris]
MSALSSQHGIKNDPSGTWRNENQNQKSQNEIGVPVFHTAIEIYDKGNKTFSNESFGPFGVISAFFIILQYSNLISGFLISVFITPGARGVVFDAVLTREGQHELVVQYEQQRHVDPMTKCQKVSQDDSSDWALYCVASQGTM